VSETKLKKSSGPPDLKLEPTPDILAEVGETRRTGGLPELKVLVGYCAETGDLEEAARKKLKRKSLDLAVANLVGAEDSGVGLATLRALIVGREGDLDDLGLVTKRELAGRLLNRVAGLL
jgi:phosphopantothenoylcysteine decarboxylase/phosphopantothenate--cysteine ligase